MDANSESKLCSALGEVVKWLEGNEKLARNKYRGKERT